jgi:Transposase IS66 family
VKVPHDENKNGKTLDPPAAWFAYTPDRKGGHPQAHLSDFRGMLQADAYAGFDAIYEAGSIREAACWAHVRRKFYDLQVAHKSPVAEEALRRIGELYAIEADLRGRKPAERRQIRSVRSRPLLESLKQRHGGSRHEGLFYDIPPLFNGSGTFLRLCRPDLGSLAECVHDSLCGHTQMCPHRPSSSTTHTLYRRLELDAYSGEALPKVGYVAGGSLRAWTMGSADAVLR